MKEDDVSYVRLYDKKGQELASGEFYQEKGSFPVDIALAPDAAETGSRYARRDKGQNLFHGYFL